MTNPKPIYRYHPQFVLRTALLPIGSEPLTPGLLTRLCQEAYFLEAIYLASPVLHDEILKWQNKLLTEEKEINKLLVSVGKYYNRMRSRCTPYGLFAACATGSWSDKNEIVLSDEIKRHTRLDMNYLCALAQQLNSHPLLLPLLKFYPNNSMYVFGDNLRYVEYKYVNNRRVHQISSVDNSEYLQTILRRAETGATPGELAPLLVESDISLEEAHAFVHELINSQILVSELEPAVTGDEFIHQLISSLKSIRQQHPHEEITGIIQILEDVQNHIAQLDLKLGNGSEKYRDIFGKLKTLNTPIEENQLFQTDSYKNTQICELNTSIQDSLRDALGFLNKFSPRDEQRNRSKFIENFTQAYENAEIPLLEALDTESGIGYVGKDTNGINALLDDVFIPGTEQAFQEIRWNKLQGVLHGRLAKAAKNDDYTVTFTDDDLKGIDSGTNNLPDTLPVMFRVLDKSGKLFVGHMGGSSAANLLGRFAHGDAAINNIINTITTHEQDSNPDQILAEIVHLPESRIGNILLRPVLRKYEIPYLGKSALPADHQILLQDLMVSVKGDKIILRSKKLNKEIIPRLSSAHNYSYNALPVYHFLCELQTQQFEKSGLTFDWGVLRNNYKFLPRAEYKNVILSRAQWQFSKADFAVLLDDSKPDYAEKVSEWIKTWKLPRHVVLADGDNELYLDLHEAFSLKILSSAIRKRDQIVLEEFLFEEDNCLVHDQKGAGYTNECIAIFLKNTEIPSAKHAEPVQSQTGIPVFDKTPVQRNFSIGSEWLYYKIYCGIKTADNLLGSVLKPLTEELTQKNLADEFFFIRYADPQVHIRIRFHMTDVSKIGQVIALADKYLRPFQQQGLIHRIQTDTYSRELERYGSNSMKLSESVFHFDSLVTLNLLDMTDGEEGEEIRWQFALRSVDELLDNFNYDSSAKLVFLEQLRNMFTSEHGGTKELKLQLDTKFRNVRKQVEDILNRELDPQREILPLIELLNWKTEQMQPIAAQILDLQKQGLLQLRLNDLLASYIHMMINRIFKSRQRTFEMVVYDLLHRYHKSLEGRKKSQKNAAPVV
jgi:thiopeptide-type bacteriocin biosynthesis protein